MTEDTLFERRRHIAVQRIGQAQEAAKAAFGTGKSAPYGQVKLKPQERLDYFNAQPDQKKLELWGQMDEAERQEIGRALTGR